MSTLVILALLFSTLMLILTTGAVVILFWHSARRELYTYFSWLLLAVVGWVMISIINHTTQELGVESDWHGFAYELGFALTCITSYMFAAKLADVRGIKAQFIL